MKICFQEKSVNIEDFFALIKQKTVSYRSPPDSCRIYKIFKDFMETELKNFSMDLKSISEKAKKYFKTKDDEGNEKKKTLAELNDIERQTIDNIFTETKTVNQFFTRTITSETYKNDEEMIR